jgi:class 3 adenylate cyclase/tetratricopeptide (TPR) repeat protein
MPSEQSQLETVIEGLEAQRSLLGDALVDASLTPLRAKLAALASNAPPDSLANGQTLKYATVLFTDIVGSTSMSQQLDPEDIHSIMDGALVRFTALVEQHNGRVLKFMGDGMMAAFGLDAVREDDAEGAVRAGLALLDETQRYAVEVAQRHAIGSVNIRVGIHTGEVLVGGGVDAENSIRGMAVNIAARMEQTTPPGSLRISRDTYRHVRGIFELEPQPPLMVKGRDEPIDTYMVLRTKARAFRVATRGIEGVETRMIGRDAELELLQEAFKRLHHQGATLDAMTVVADAGLGKSRLLYEFQNWTEARPQMFSIYQGRATPQTQGLAYGLLRDIVAWRLQIHDSDSMETAKQKMEQGIAPLFVADDGVAIAQAHAQVLGHLIGLNFDDSPNLQGAAGEGKLMRNRGFHVAAQMFRRMAAQSGNPILLLLEDLHWADDGSLDFLNYLFQVNRDVPMLVLAVTRPALFERRADWPPLAHAQRINLSPLDKTASRLLANEILKRLPDIPAALRELITSGAEGNPFYMEELVKMLVDSGAIEIQAEHWSVNPERLLATKIPPTLTGVLQARLDSLDPSEKLALQQASIYGQVFWDQALAAIDPSATHSLPALVQRELALPQTGASLQGNAEQEREYSFKHQILHQVTYDTVLKSTRRQYHAHAAAWLAGLTGARAQDFLGVAAEHYAKAGDSENAAEFFHRAAKNAQEHYASSQEIIDYVSQGLEQLDLCQTPETPESLAHLRLRAQLIEIRWGQRRDQRQMVEARSDLEHFAVLAEQLNDDLMRSKLAQDRGSRAAVDNADYHAALREMQMATDLAKRAGDNEQRLFCQSRVALGMLSTGDRSGAKALLLSGLEDAHALGLRLNEARFLAMLSVIEFNQDELIAGLESLDKSIRINKEFGRLYSLSYEHCRMCGVALSLGIQPLARSSMEEAVRLQKILGAPLVDINTLICQSALALREGDDAMALAHAQAAVDIMKAKRSSADEVRALQHLGEAELVLGRYAQARNIFREAVTVAMARGDTDQYDAMSDVARASMALNDVDSAMKEIQAVLSFVDGGGDLRVVNERLILLTCYQVLAKAKDERANDMLARAYANLQARAATISDPAMRHGFLNNVPAHRQIAAAWDTIQALPRAAP